MKNSWPVQDAKARFSEFLNSCMNHGPQVVTRRGSEAAVLVPIAEWKRLKESVKPTLKSLLLSDDARGNLEIPKRGHTARRKLTSL